MTRSAADLITQRIMDALQSAICLQRRKWN